MASSLLKHTYQNTNYLGNIDLFYTEDVQRERGLTDEVSKDVEAWKKAYDFLELNEDKNELINANAKKHSLEGIAILIVNGKDINKKWCYSVGEKHFPIQNWINKVDGKYKALIIDSPNPERNQIKSKTSPVLTLESNAIADFFLPGIGYMDSYLIEEELNRLKE